MTMWLLVFPQGLVLTEICFVLTSSGFTPIFSHVSNFLYDFCSEVRRIFCSLISFLSFYLFYVLFFWIGDETSSCFYCVVHDPLSCSGNSLLQCSWRVWFSFWYFFYQRFKLFFTGWGGFSILQGKSSFLLLGGLDFPIMCPAQNWTPQHFFYIGAAHLFCTFVCICVLWRLSSVKMFCLF